jgi:hypothetical protein
MIAPKLSKSMSETQAKEGLQSAINKLAEIYTMIGTITIEEVDRHPVLQPIVAEYRSGLKYLEALADDKIPF